jgi:hypothetical protein
MTRKRSRGAPQSAQTGMPWAPSPTPRANAIARPGPAKANLCSRWTPRHVWTLHRVPGRIDGPPLAVRRRVLSEGDENFVLIETPGGDMSVHADDLSSVASGGRARTTGSGRFDYRKEPPICGFFYGCDLQIDVFDHEPTEEERARWLEVRRRFSAMLKRTPKHAYLASPGDGRYRVEKVQIRRPEGYRDFGSRYDLDVRRPRAEWRVETCAPCLCDLAEQGWSHVGPRPDGVRLYLAPPPQAELDQFWREHAAAVELDERYKREAREFGEALGRAIARSQQQSAERNAALAELGLDADATPDEVQRAYRQRIAAERAHPDQGGDRARFETLTAARDVALRAVAAS